MSINNGNSIVKNGLVFHYDMFDPTSWRGKPTTNLVYGINPVTTGDRADYEKSSNTTDASFNTNHPGRIKFLRADGGVQGDLINGGVNSGNWEITHHCHNQYDNELRKPVYVMNDVDGVWKANSFNMTPSHNLSTIGWNVGQQYSISWLGWTTDIAKTANAGIYYRNVDGVSRGFYAGQAYAQQTAFNTEPYKWQRVYATFTVPSDLDDTYNMRVYCYGMHGGRGTVKMADIQIEEGLPSHFVKEGNITKQSRSSTESLVDKTGNNIISIASLTYESSGDFSFNGTSDYIDLPNDLNYTSSVSAFAWFKSLGTPSGSYHIIFGGQELEISIPTSGQIRTGVYQGARYVSNHGAGLLDGDWHYVGFTFDGATKTSFIDGENVGAQAVPAGTLSSIFSNRRMGRYGFSDTYYANGKIPQASIYNRALSESEVKQNFNALKGRYGL